MRDRSSKRARDPNQLAHRVFLESIRISEAAMKWVYKITYPSGKIYVGMDLTGTFRYFGSPDSAALEADFTPEQRRDFTVRREIIWDSETATDSEMRAKEV